ncbi:Uncharacterised protein [Vibrio cholerae]|nr:Uncharacterised protein [Vibrio cholerae]CSH81815.1 Uncharacterised protein [Vibrio cholerae]
MDGAIATCSRGVAKTRSKQAKRSKRAGISRHSSACSTCEPASCDAAKTCAEPAQPKIKLTTKTVILMGF